MNDTWNLDRLYTGFDDPAWAADFETLTALAAAYGALAKELPTIEPLEGIRRGVALEEDLQTIALKMFNYCNLRQSTNTRDSEAGSHAGQIYQVINTTAGPETVWRSWCTSLPNLMELVDGDERLKDCHFFFQTMGEDSRYRLSEQTEEIAARMKLSGSSAWSDLQQHLTSTVKVRYRDQTIGLAAVRNLAYDPDPQVRKDAFEAELACYPQIQDSVAFALNSIKLETLSLCQIRGYASPLDRTLKNSHMERATLDAMFRAMDAYLPKFWQYLRTKAEALGHKNGLPWYDLFAPMGNSSTTFTTRQARDYLVELFGAFNPEEAEMIATAFDDDWIDFYPHDGKAGGAFCATIQSLKESRILTNFDGMFTDVVTLAHELGHAYHNFCLRGNRPVNQHYSMPLAETASTFNECVVMASAINRAASKEEKLALVESQLQDTTQIICDIYSRFRFEDAVFTRRPREFLDADTLCSLMTDAQKQSYGDGLDPDCLHPWMWVCKSHYYGPTYYNFPYAFGGLFARGLYARYEEEGAAFLPKYRQLLRTTAVATAEDTAKVAGIDLTDESFWRSALETVAQQIDLFCELVKENS